MNHHFIWINPEKYSAYQKCRCTTFDSSVSKNYCVVAFRKEHHFSKAVQNVTIRIFADTKYALYVNQKFLGYGPVCSGGDYGNKKAMPVQYYSEYPMEISGNTLAFFIQVQLSPIVHADNSCGAGGFTAQYVVKFEDGTEEIFYTDPSWQCRLEKQYIDVFNADFTAEPSAWESPVAVESIWNLKKSRIKNLVYEKILPDKIERNEKQEIVIEFSKIYAAYLVVQTKQDCCLEIESFELPTKIPTKRGNLYTLKMQGDVPFRSLRLDSIGGLKIRGTVPENIEEIYLLFSHYPVSAEGTFHCSDPMLNLIYEVGKHTTNVCRQTIELDSPTHQENLGDAGDYLIESLIAYYCFGDTTLSKFDCIRIAEYLKLNQGKLFHTSYSLIWVQMVYDNYLFSGDFSVLEETKEALDILLARFAGYEDENHILENCDDYMFIDWIPIDGYNLHHPPKALGQSSMNAFYYNALLVAAKIYTLLD